ncbi:MAG: Spy/CpxP family protein refolding chaperone [Abditibacteriota bacterium]|nr:Spy/CpxP family protein refolding chaperone [Abditibacteriota bacterium]
MKKLFIFALCLMVMAAAAFAQEGGMRGPGGGRQGGMRGPGGPGMGPGGPGMMGGMMAGGMMNPMMMMGNQGFDFDKSYLKLKEEEVKKVDALIAKYNKAQQEAFEAMRKQMEEARANGTGQPGAPRGNGYNPQAQREAFEKELKALLTKEQGARYDNLLLKNRFFMQIGVYNPMSKTRLEDKLNLTEEQDTKIDALLTKFQKPTAEIEKEGRSLMESMRNTQDREGMMAKMQQLNEKSAKNLTEFETEYKTLLTSEQINAFNQYAKSLQEEIRKMMEERRPAGGDRRPGGGERRPGGGQRQNADNAA